MIKGFRTYDLALSFHKQCQKLKLPSPMNDQFQRASLSVVLNISEGSAKQSKKDRGRFYRISFGSLRETQTLLDIVGHVELICQADVLGQLISTNYVKAVNEGESSFTV